MYTYEIEITPDYCFFAMFSKELNVTLCLYVDRANYDYSNLIVAYVDELLRSLGFVPGKLEAY